MNYDETDIAAAYDRGRDHGPEYLKLWMDLVSAHVGNRGIETILDLGCGTGRFSEALALRFDAKVIAIDPSERMLEQARNKASNCRIRFELGRGESIPVQDESVDLIFMSMSFHHFDDPALAARECRRVLRRQATAFLRTGTREQILTYPYVEFFPESVLILEQCLPTKTYVRDVFEAAGFRTVADDLVTQKIAPSHAAYADKLSAGADSVLASLSSRDFDAGIAALREHAARIYDQPVFESIDVLAFR